MIRSTRTCCGTGHANQVGCIVYPYTLVYRRMGSTHASENRGPSDLFKLQTLAYRCTDSDGQT